MSPRTAKLAALLAFLLPCLALAASTVNGQVAGYVYDPTGAPLAEVPLTIKGPALIQPITRTSGDDGRFTFDLLPPGEDYTIEVNVPGFTPVQVKNVKVRLGQTSSVDVNLTVMTESAQAAQTFQIVEKVNPVLNPDTAQTGSVITGEAAQGTPQFTQVETMPQQVAGVGPGNKPSTKGGFSRWGKFYVDGMDTTDVTDGSITSPINFYSVENFEVITGGLDAQYNSMGMIENVVTKSGSNKLTYDASLVVQPTFLSASPAYPAAQPSYIGNFVSSSQPSPAKWFYSPALNVGGPLKKDKLWYYFSVQLNRNHSEIPLQTPFTPFEDRPSFTVSDLARAKLTWQATAKDRASLAFDWDHNSISNWNAGFNNGTESSESQILRSGFFVTSNYDHNFTDNLLFQLQAGMTYKDTNQFPQHIVSDAAHFDLNSRTSFGEAGQVSSGEGNELHEWKQRWEFDPTLSWHLGKHQLKGGVQLSYQRSRMIHAWVGGTGYTTYSDFDVPNTAYGTCDSNNPTSSACYDKFDYYNTLGQQAPLETHAAVFGTGLFLQDRWTINRHLEVIPGIRFDVGRLYGDNDAFITNLVGVGPRLSATYDLTGDRTTIFTAHYGRSNDTGNILVAQHANAQLYKVTSFAIPGGFADCNLFNAATSKNCLLSGGPSGRQFAGGQTPPHVDEIAVGAHHQVFAETVLGLDLTYRRYSDLWSDVEVNRIYDPTGTTVVGGVNGTTASVLRAQTPSSAYRDYKDAELWIQGDPGPWHLLASYTLAFARGTVDDYFTGFGSNPRQDLFYNGYVNDDRRHQLKGSVNYRTTFGLDVGVRLQYRTGTPLWETYTNPVDGSALFHSPRGTGFAINSTTGAQNINDPGSWVYLRNPDFFETDLQIRYDLGQQLLGMKQNRLEVAALFVNALNQTYPSSLSSRYATNSYLYGTANSITTPFQSELTIRFRN
jgi:hypothetical protein